MGVVLLVCKISLSTLESHIASLEAVHDEIYSASTEERAMELCFIERHDTAPPHMMKAKPSVDLRVSLQPAQSESQYPLIVVFAIGPYRRERFYVPLM